jgi:hypothetical protein
MPLQRIGSFLGASEELKTLSARTRRLQALQTLYLRSAPRELAGSSRVKSYRAGTLTVSADNPAVAAKLKQLSPTLLASIRETEAEVTVLRIEVQVSGAARSRTRPPRKVPLSIDAVEKFEELSESIADGDLKSALTRLVKHHLRHK